jgi:hypothetical protein
VISNSTAEATISGLKITNFGAHCDSYNTPYLTAAASIGMSDDGCSQVGVVSGDGATMPSGFIVVFSEMSDNGCSEVCLVSGTVSLHDSIEDLYLLRTLSSLVTNISTSVLVIPIEAAAVRYGVL